MGIMLRVAGVPSRVVLGYTHDPARNGSFLVNSTDAHAWVEAFLPGAGWIPFDPTPGVQFGRAADGGGLRGAARGSGATVRS